MDHLASYVKDKVELLRIPYLSEDARLAYDGKGYYGFPERVGFDVAELWAPSWDKSVTDDDRVTFMQSWLYFGFAHEVFGGIIDDTPLPLVPKHLVRIEGDRIVVDSTNVILAVVAWMAVKEYETEEKRVQRAVKLNKLLRDVGQVLEAITNAMDAQLLPFFQGELSESMAQMVFFSISLLGEQIEAGFASLYDDYRGKLRMAVWPMSLSMKQSYLNWIGICAAEWGHLTRATPACHSMTAFHYIMRQIIPSLNHMKCTESQCLATETEQAQRTTLHVYENCQCEPVRLDQISQIRLQDFVENRKIPMVVVHEKSSSNQPAASVEVVEYERSEDQICFAISYVCSDQIGFPEVNSILACQLLKIHRRVMGVARHHKKWPKQTQQHRQAMQIQDLSNSLSRNKDEIENSLVMPVMPVIGFWMDTMCIPGDALLKQRALIQMHDIYRDVDGVLVLEKLLERANTDHGNLTAIYQICMSIWNRRLWTLQEGILNPNTRFLLEDDDIPVEHLIMLHDKGDALAQPLLQYREFLANNPYWEGEPITNNMPVTILDPIYRSLRFEMLELRRILFSGENPSNRLLHQLAFRKTTDPRDEPLCIAILLNLDLVCFQTLSFDDQMMQILRKLGQFRTDIIFDLSPRLDAERFRWAPRNLLGRADHEGMRTGGHRKGSVGDRGFMVELPAFLGIDKEIKFTMSPEGKLSYGMLGLQIGASSYRVIPLQHRESFMDATCSGPDSLVMVLLESAAILDGRAQVAGCLVKYITTEGDVIYVQPLLVCTVDREGEAAGMAGMAADRFGGWLEGDNWRLPRMRSSADVLPSAFVNAKYVEPQRYCLV